MFLLLLCFTIFHFAHSSCPAGFDLVRDGQCRGYYQTLQLSEDEAGRIAVAKCKELDGVPPIIHNDEDQAYWKSQKTKSDYLILGLVCNNTSKRWQWADGSPLDYIPPCHDIALQYDCSPSYTWGMFNNNGIWYQAHIAWLENFDIFCTTQLHQPVPPVDECRGFEQDSDDDVCYKIDTTAVTWKDAEQSCKKLGANVASIHNPNENSFIRRMAVSNGAVNGVFLGATYAGKGDTLEWLDGSDWDYNNFYPGFPMHAYGDCVAMDTFAIAGQWMNVECSEKYPVACVREKIPIVEKNVTCGAQYFNEGETITSPGFPNDASLPCEYYLTVETGKKVQVEITFLEANSCCDSLVLYDGYDLALASLTGEIRNATYITHSSNIMRVSWQPNGGVNVRGMALTFRGV